MSQNKMASLHGGYEPGCRLQHRCISKMSSSFLVTMENNMRKQPAAALGNHRQACELIHTIMQRAGSSTLQSLAFLRILASNSFGQNMDPLVPHCRPCRGKESRRFVIHTCSNSKI
jgi:hypothetical protein